MCRFIGTYLRITYTFHTCSTYIVFVVGIVSFSMSIWHEIIKILNEFLDSIPFYDDNYVSIIICKKKIASLSQT